MMSLMVRKGLSVLLGLIFPTTIAWAAWQPAGLPKISAVREAPSKTNADRLKGEIDVFLAGIIAEFNPRSIEQIIESLRPIPSWEEAMASLPDEPNAPYKRVLDGKEAKQVKALDKRIQESLAYDELDEAIRLAEQIAQTRALVQGEDHWQFVDARRMVDSLKHFVALPNTRRRELAKLESVEAKVFKSGKKRHYHDALREQMQAANIRRRCLGPGHQRTLDSILFMALILEQVWPSRAELLYRVTFEAHCLQLGLDHPSTLTSLAYLATNLANQKKVSQAELLACKAMDVSRRVLGSVHTGTLAQTSLLADLIQLQGRPAGAEILLRQSLDSCRQELGDQHRNTLLSVSNLAGQLYDQGKLFEAEPLYRELMEFRYQHFGLLHPDTLSSMHILALCLANQRKNTEDEAESLYREALESYRRTKGNHDPDTLTAMHSLAMLLHAEGEFSEAELLHREALASRRRVLGNDHFDTLVSIANLAVLYSNQGKYSDAELLYRELWQRRRDTFGEADWYTLNTMRNLSSVLHKQGKLSDAGELRRKAVEIFRNNWGDEHHDTLLALADLGWFLQLQGKLYEAESLIRQTLNIQRQILSDAHPHTLSSMYSLAALLENQGELSEAERLYKESLESTRRILGEKNPQTLTAMGNLAHFFQRQGRFDLAEPLYRETVKTSTQVLGKHDTATLYSMSGLADSVSQQGRYSESESLHRQALKTKREILGDQHPDTLSSMTFLGRFLQWRGRSKEAMQMLTMAADCFEVSRLRVSSIGIERVEFTARQSPLLSLAACLVQNGEPRQAWQRLEAHLARGLLDALSARYARPLDRLERKQEDQLLVQWARLDEQIAILSSSDDENQVKDELDSYRRQRHRVRLKYLKFQQSLEDKYGPAVGRTYSLDQIQKHIPADTALIAWLDIDDWGREEHWACLVRNRGEPLWKKLPGSGKYRRWSKEDSGRALRVRDILASRARQQHVYDRKFADDLKQLYEQRLAPIEPYLDGVRHLIVLPAGRMAGVPIEALTDKYTVSYALSGTTYAWLKETTGKKARGRGLFALGNPIFGRAEETTEPLPPPAERGVFLATVTKNSNAARGGIKVHDVLQFYAGKQINSDAELDSAIQQHVDSASRIETADSHGSASKSIPVRVWRNGKPVKLTIEPGPLGVEFSKLPVREAVESRRRFDEALRASRGKSYAELPYSEKEVEQIAHLFKTLAPSREENQQILIGYEASERELDKLVSTEKLQEFGCFHFATHGEMNDQQAMRSALILARDETEDAIDRLRSGQEVFDGRLTPDQIVRTWKLNADLVVLSACETAGKPMEGEGYLGFSQAFLLAGARSVILSLWKVHDLATALLMVRFYENLLGAFEDSRRLPHRSYGPGEAMTKADALFEAKQWVKRNTPEQNRKALSKLGLLPSKESGVRAKPGQRAGSDPPTEFDFSHPYYWAAFIQIGDPE
ncbi:MAG: tetratricopeptide repeat protein [Phycisphaerales bacterium]|nr:tetratricopeptide repeat protein [Phycisphaerales bacterium]